MLQGQIFETTEIKIQNVDLSQFHQHRDLLFTNPVFTNYLELTVMGTDPFKYSALNLKLDFIGMTREKMHSRERINMPGRVVKDVISPYRYSGLWIQ